MKCPVCDEKTKVVDSREKGWRTKRKRICKKCGHSFFTVELLRDEREPKRKPKNSKKKKIKRPCESCYYSDMCTEEDMLLGEEEKFSCYMRGDCNA